MGHKTTRIVDVRVESTLKNWIRYDDGEFGAIDFASLAQSGGVYTRLADPQYFQRVSIGENGRFLEWPDRLDSCADALREKLLHPGASG